MRNASRLGTLGFRGGVLVAVLLAGCDTTAGRAPDTIFTGHFLTLDGARPEVEALAVSGSRIVAVGTRTEIERLADERTVVIDVGGVGVPGFADAHVHASGLGNLLEELNLQAMDKDEIIAAVAEAVRSAAPGTWISGRGWDEGFFTPSAFPTAEDLDSISPDNPVVLGRIDGHSSWVNTRVLELSGITASTVDPDGGRVVRDARGEPTGVLVDAAEGLIVNGDGGRRPDPERRLRAALEQYARWGLTSVHDAGVGADVIDVYKALADAGELPVRVYAMARGRSTVDDYLERGPEITGDGLVTVRSVKVLLDGALGSRGAELTDPYADAPDERGLPQMSDAELDALVERARAAGFQVNAHVIGDRAVTRALDVFERAGVERDERFRLEHASIIAPRDLGRFAALGIVASMQPTFVGEYGRWAEDRLGPERVRWVMPIRDLIATGAVVASGTDYPASDSGDPRATLAGLVARQSSEGEPPGGWYADQAVDVETALQTMSEGPAYAAFQEDDLGRLTVGRYADITVLSEDPRTVAPEALRVLEIRMTVMGGRITYNGRTP